MINHRIRFWQRTQTEATARIAAERARNEQAGIRADVAAAAAYYDMDIHDRNQLPVGMLLDSIDPERLGGRQPTVEELLEVAEAGFELLYSALCVGSGGEGFEEFVDELRETRGGEVVDAALGECGLMVWPDGEKWPPL
jgi:hypothetical protein